MKETTFVMIKPNAMRQQKAGAIIKRFQDEGLRLRALKLLWLSPQACGKFYKEHLERPFFQDLVKFMSSHPVMALAFSGENAVLKVREIMGHTDPKKADKNSLRAQYGDSIGENAVHGSDSVESAKQELDFIFAPEELDLFADKTDAKFKELAKG